MKAPLFRSPNFRLLAAVVLLSLLALAKNSSAQTYVLIDLGDATEIASVATGINSNGVVCGYSIYLSGVTNRAWKWSTATGHVYLGGFGGAAHGFVFNEGSGLTDIGSLLGADSPANAPYPFYKVKADYYVQQ